MPKKKVQKKKVPQASAKPQVKRAWSTQERVAVETHLKKFIIQGVLPGKKNIEKCIEMEQEILKNRTWRNVKDYCRNKINKNQKN